MKLVAQGHPLVMRGAALLCIACGEDDHRNCAGDPCACTCAMERVKHAQRVSEGLRRARRRGKRIGRPSVEVDGNDVLKLRAKGFSLREIADTVGASKSWVQAFLKKKGDKCR